MRSSLGNSVRTIEQEATLDVRVTLPPPGERLLENSANKVDSKGQGRNETES